MLAERIAQDDVALGIHLRVEDERMQNPVALVPFVPLKDAVALAKRHPTLQVVVFGMGRPGEASCLVVGGVLRELAEKPNSQKVLGKLYARRVSIVEDFTSWRYRF